MAKHISKSVIEDIAYQLKRVGIITKAYEDHTASDNLIGDLGTYEYFDISGTATVNWIIENIAEVLNEHSPTFDYDRFKQQASFEIDS